MSPRMISHPSHLPESHKHESRTTRFIDFSGFGFLLPGGTGLMSRTHIHVSNSQECPSMASMENPRMSEIMDFNENHYSVRQKIGDPGSKSIRNIFPLHPVTSKRPESPYGAKNKKLAEHPVFQFFGLWQDLVLHGIRK